MDRCEKIKKLQQRRKELLDLGLCCSIVGPRGPRGEGINIIDVYKDEDELLNNHPIGKTGDAYLVNSHLFIWSEKDGIWKDAGSIKGEKGDQGLPGPKGENGLNGECEIIDIVNTNTLEPGKPAYVEDTFTNNTHYLTINIPKGEKGEKGDQGVQGDQGIQGEMGPVLKGSTEGILFVSFAEVNISGEMPFQDTLMIPNSSEYFKLNNKTDILLTEGIYEIAFSGAIEDTDGTHGGIFYLKDENNQVVMDLSFKISPGATTQDHFSQNVIHEFKNKTTLQVMAGIIGDIGSSRVKINDVNLIIKKIHV